jgi:hypothetical protein
MTSPDEVLRIAREAGFVHANDLNGMKLLEFARRIEQAALERETARLLRPSTEMTRDEPYRSDKVLYYLRSILRQMNSVMGQPASRVIHTLGQEALADNCDWLDCYIDWLERHPAAPPLTPQEPPHE